ncbi:MAG: single-stranded DNA-binding protein [Carnobacterium sp.]|uniref:single-stranded DNA-binding protein n=1 Tax=Carnobacterium sp. TaxID=48221 RepID=UPI003C70E17D
MINNVVLTGRLTKDADLRYTSNGIAVANFTVAVNRKFKKDGQPEADFINCVIWRNGAEALANHTRKGSLIGVEGSIQTRSYDNDDGKKVYVTEVVVKDFTFLESKGSSESTTAPAKNETKEKYPDFGNKDPFDKSSQPIDISDDDLPF